jgi:hypothetical protein
LNDLNPEISRRSKWNMRGRLAEVTAEFHYI